LKIYSLCAEVWHVSVDKVQSPDRLGFLEFLISLLHVLQIENLQRSSASGITADQLIDLPEAAGIHQAHLRRRKEAQERE